MGPSEDLKRIATTLVMNCRNGDDARNLEDLYAEDAVSVEAFAMPGDDPVRRGRDQIRAKHDWWNANMEIEPDSPTGEAMAEGPFYHGNDRFSVIFRLKARDRNSGQVMDMVETATYHVADGKIVREEFFYGV